MKIIKGISLVIVLATTLSIYSWMVNHVSIGGEKLGPLTEPIKAFYSLPITIKNTLFTNFWFPTYMKPGRNFEAKNELDYDLYALNSSWNPDQSVWDIKLFNFRNDSILHTWTITEDVPLEYTSIVRQFKNSLPFHSLLAKDKSLVTFLSVTPNLYRLDSNSNVMWSNHEIGFHHSLNFDADSNIWACTSFYNQQEGWVYRNVKNYNKFRGVYRTNNITKVDFETGKILYNKPISEIFLKNGYKGLMFGMSLADPIHLNDVQPALEDTEFWKKDDLFLSIRNRSLIMVYRPSTGKIIHLIQGPFVNQHDVDIISDHELSLFNNNYVLDKGGIDGIHKTNYVIEKAARDTLRNAEVITYNFQDSTFSKVHEGTIKKERINTPQEGLCEILSNGDVFIEATNSGRVYIASQDGIVLRKVFEVGEGYIERPNWIRVYETLNF